MESFGFQNLKVWEKAHGLVLEIYKATQQFPEEEKYGLVSQIRRSAISICANIAEGSKKSKKDFSRFLAIARGSLEETKYHLILGKDLGYLSETIFEKLFHLSDETGKMLYRLIQSINPSLTED